MTTADASTKGQGKSAGATPAKDRDERLWFLGFFSFFVIIAMFSVFYFWLALFVDLNHIHGVSLTQRSWGADFIILAVAIFLILLFLTCVPLFLVMRYKRIEYGKLEEKLQQDLWLCGFAPQEAENRVKDFQAKNSWEAYFFPTVIITFYLYLMFGTILLSHGVYGIVVSFSGETCLQYGFPSTSVGAYTIYPTTCKVGLVDVPQFLFNLPRTAAPISWAFLGAYFYAIAVLFRRWQRTDLTAGTMWKLTARFAVAFILGLLLTKIAPTEEALIIPSLAFPGTAAGLDLHSIDERFAVEIALIAFMIGIVPDGFLNRIFLRVRNSIQYKKNPFKPSDLQEKIDGLNFWQEDRLMEEGIESVEDLAMTDITDLLVKIRFDTPHLLYWVDQALLSHQAGEDDFPKLKSAHVLTASDLLYLTVRKKSSPILEGEADPEKVKAIWSSLGDASWDREDPTKAPIAYGSFKNIVDCLRNTPNVPYVWSYMTYTRNLERRAEREEELRKYLEGPLAESKQLPDSYRDDQYEMLFAEIGDGLDW